MKLNALHPGQSAVIRAVGGEGALRQHFLDMGVIPGTEVTVIKLAPMGDPMELRIHGYELTLRLADAGKIDITPVDLKETGTEQKTGSPGSIPAWAKKAVSIPRAAVIPCRTAPS